MTSTPPDSAVDELAPPERSAIVGGSALVAALMLGSVVLQVAADPTLPVNERWVAGGIGGLVAFAALVAAHRLLTLRGGLWLDLERRRLGMGMTGARDIWWVDLDRISAFVCSRRLATSDVADFAWRAVARLGNGLELVLVETHEREIAEAVAEQLRARSGLPGGPETEDTEAAPEPQAATSTSTTVTVSRAVAMHGPLAVAAFTLTVLGAALYSQIHAAPALGFFVAPVLLFTGLALAAVIIVKRVSTEHLEHRGGLWTNRFVCGPFGWGERTISAPKPVWSLHVRPARGARIELEGDDAILIIGHGATTLSQANVEDLAAMPDRFAS